VSGRPARRRPVRPLRLLLTGLAALLLPVACTAPGQGQPQGQHHVQAAAPGEDVWRGSDSRGDGDPSILVIDVLDVGQGDAILLRSDGRAVLYDGGTGSIAIVPMLRALGVDSLSLVVASHNHADHIGGLVDVIREFRPRFVLENGVSHTTRTYERFLEAIRDAGSQLLEPTARRIALGHASLHVLPPPGRQGWGHNDNSVGVRIEAGSFRATLLGDSEHRQQAWWLDTMPDAFPTVSLHKASHHGSRNGDTQAMIARLAPEIVVISAADGNSYDHPHPEALALYEGVGALVYRTDRHGHIRIDVAADGSYRVTTLRSAPQAAS
jgi:competence protein ComEC